MKNWILVWICQNSELIPWNLLSIEVKYYVMDLMNACLLGGKSLRFAALYTRVGCETLRICRQHNISNILILLACNSCQTNKFWDYLTWRNYLLIGHYYTYRYRCFFRWDLYDCYTNVSYIRKCIYYLYMCHRWSLSKGMISFNCKIVCILSFVTLPQFESHSMIVIK